MSTFGDSHFIWLRAVTAFFVAVLVVAIVVHFWALLNPLRASQNQDFPPSIDEVSNYDWAMAPETALFIGDSFSVGTGANPQSNRWTSVVARESGWRESNRALSGTGYVASVDGEVCGLHFCPAYIDHLKRVVAEVRADVVVIAGGQNDLASVQSDPATVEEKVQATYRVARNIYPESRIIAVGPPDPSGNSEAVTKLDSIVRQASVSVDAEFVSLLNPSVISSDMVLRDGTHVDSYGHNAIAQRVLAVVGDVERDER